MDAVIAAQEGRAFSVALRGVSGQIVTVEAGLAAGLPGVHIAGLPDSVVATSCDRVRAAMMNSAGGNWPMAAVTVTLRPAGLPKPGSVSDLALAAAILAAQNNARSRRLDTTILLGELALDGRVRTVPGVLPATLAAKQAGWSTIVVPAENLAEAALVEGVEVWGVRTLGELIAWMDMGNLDGGLAARARDVGVPELAVEPADSGWAGAGHVVEVAAAGGHHMLVVGEDSSAPLAIARRLVATLPDLNDEEALEVTALHSVAGLLAASNPRITRPQLVSPPATSSVAGLVGGGSGLARPGAISLAHCGVLFLDDAADVGVSAREAIRFPLEDGEIRLARRDGVVSYPARFQLVLGTRDCPCAAARGSDCTCSTPMGVQSRRGLLSGPLIDRIDVCLRLSQDRPARSAEGAGGGDGAARERVAAAQLAARQRWRLQGFRSNAEVTGSVLRRKFRPSSAAMAPLRTALERGSISMRAVDRCLRVAWTIADLAGRTSPSSADVLMAMGFRQGGVA